MIQNVETPYYISKSDRFIKNRVKNCSTTLISSFKSYMTGLKFHKYVEKPSKNRIYLCVIEPDNKYDTNAIAIFANNDRIGYVPKELSSRVCNLFQENVAMLCYCLGRTTEFSSQCVYSLFKVDQEEEKQYQVIQKPLISCRVDTTCTLCFIRNVSTVNIPCKHSQYCDICVKTKTPKICMLCKEDVSEFQLHSEFFKMEL
jgi:hypothetical protein